MVLGTSQTENAPHRIKAALKDLVVDEPKWMQRGLSPTASGYGRRYRPDTNCDTTIDCIVSMDAVSATL